MIGISEKSFDVQNHINYNRPLGDDVNAHGNVVEFSFIL